MPHSLRLSSGPAGIKAQLTAVTAPSPVPPSYPTEQARLVAAARNREWLLLDAEVQAAVCAPVGACRRIGRLQIGTFYAGDTFAKAHPLGGILWGVNGEHGFMSARGMHQIPADLPVVIDSHAALTDFAQRWAAITDADAETADPGHAKNLLAAARNQHAAGARFLCGPIENGTDTPGARGHVDLIGEYVEAIGSAVRSRAADDAWRHAFDAAGWQTDVSILLRPPYEAMPAAFPPWCDG